MKPPASPLGIFLAVAAGIVVGGVILRKLTQAGSEPMWKRILEKAANAAVGGIASATTTALVGR